MNDYILVYHDGRVALTTRQQMYLSPDDPIWRRYVEDVTTFWNDNLLELRLITLDWVDLNKVKDEHREGALYIRRFKDGEHDIFTFDVVTQHNKRTIFNPLAYCRFDNGALRPSRDGVVYTTEGIFAEWLEHYRNAIVNYTGFPVDSWMYQLWSVIVHLCSTERSAYVYEVAQCAIVRAEQEGNLEAAEKFRRLVHELKLD